MILIALAILQTQPARAQSAGSRSYIAYVAKGSLWTADSAGQPLKRLTPDGVSASEPAWSKGGVIAYFATTAKPNRTALCAVKWDGSGSRVLADLGKPTDGGLSVAWGPDGHHLAFTSQGRLWEIDDQGRHKRPLRLPKKVGRVCDWSRDGRLLLAVSTRGADRLMAFHAKRRTAMDVTPTPFRGAKNAHIGQAKWLPDGRRIAIIGAIGGSKSAIYSFDTRHLGVRAKQLIDNPGQSYWHESLSLSPDGAEIVFGRSPAEMGVPSIWRASIDGSKARVFLTEPDPEPHSGVSSPAWSPLLKS